MQDLALIDQLLQGLPIVGQVAKSGRWPPMQLDPEAKPVKHLLDRAWEIKAKITRNIKGTKFSDGFRKIWEQTIEDCEEGSSIGPFWSEAEVTQKLGTDQWVPEV